MEDFNGNHIIENDVFEKDVFEKDDVLEKDDPKENKSPFYTRRISRTVEPLTSPSNAKDLNHLRWIEEEEGDAIYNIALKRVRYHSLTVETPLNSNISCKQWETVRIRQIKAGTLEKLVEYLTPTTESNEADPGFFLAFLCTYKSFSTTSEVTELLLKRFEYCQNNMSCSKKEQIYLQGIMKRICSVITIWFEKYPSDFDEPPTYPILSSIMEFTENRLSLPGMGELKNASHQLLDKLSVCPFDYEAPYKFKFCSCPSVVGCTCEMSICSDTFEHQQSLNISKFSAELIAEQLTLADSELFVKVSPRECLGHFWSKRDPSKGSMSQSIKLTVQQFNAVSLKVISTILSARNVHTNCLSVSSRTKVIEKWIEVASELRELKNFSSLKAILSSLQSSAIYRLAKTWDNVSKQLKEIYEELSKIFADDMNNKASRDLLMQEGTAKYSTHTLKKTNWKRDIWKKEGITHGTVPYLGTFLTDLMMIDTAHPDKCNVDLINFEKRRKEFETIVQIKLFQQAAKNYHIQPYKDFFIWFNGIPEYSDKEGYDKSLAIEPPGSKDVQTLATPQPKRRGKGVKLKRCKSESDILREQKGIRSSSCSGESDVSLANQLNSVSISTQLNSVSINDIQLALSSSSSNLNDGEKLDISFLVARVYLEDSVGAQYKSMKLYADTKACDVISMTLRKFDTTDDPTQYSLYQIMDNKKTFHIPMNSNMFYAMGKCKKDICFKVCKKQLTKKWRNSGHTVKLSSFHRKLRKPSLDTEDLGVMFRSYSPLS